MKKVFRVFDDIIIGLMSLCTIVFVILIFAQVIGRYIFNSSITWSEELARYLFAESVFLGSGICVLEKKHACIDILPNLIPEKYRRYYLAVIDIFIILLGILLSIFGNRFLVGAIGQKSPAMRIPFQYIYIGIVVGGVALAIDGARAFYTSITGKSTYHSYINPELNQEEN